ncbi:TonB-dependent receptor family protein [Acinetobacter rathckeae]|uniref:TonB-dependent receptor family protein n=1 Tax=Acinetobacter rathckeae TaxID=2605272 RepID=UPI0018A265C8|nr:TonB-dependent siderophore receptor [Acinetobacter rathckeae]MBF7696084.1 TonB-dependent siderophore receptor [Acinetobacter rathckeae]
MYFTTTRLTKIALSVACVGLGSSFSYATSNDVTLDTIAVQAQGNWLDDVTAKKVLDHAGARTIIDRQRMDDMASTTIKDALKQIPGVQVQDNAGTAGSDLSLSFGVRGLSSRFSPRSTVLIDGVPLAFAPYGQPQLSLAPTSLGNIESIDVIRGAGSVRFGPQNVGGIINFNTRAIPEKFQGNVALTNEIAKNGHVKMSPNVFLGTTFENGLGLALLYSGTQGDGYRERNDHNNINDVVLKTAYRINPHNNIEFNVHRYDAKAGMPGGLTVQQYSLDPNQSTRPYDFFSGHRTDGSLKYTYSDDVNQFELLAYHTDTYRNAVMEKINDTDKNKTQLRNAPRSYKVTAFEPRFSHAYAWGNTSNEVSVGYRYLHEDSQEYIGRSAWYKSGATPLSVDGYSAADGDTTAHAVYLDHKTQWNDWSITPGVRFESIKSRENYYKLNANNSVKNSVATHVNSNEVLPNLSISYKANEQWNIFANYGVSFGPQQYSQMAKIDDAGKAVSQTAGLSPEKAKNYEIGTHYLGQGVTAELTAFYIDFDQELLRYNVAGTEGWTNLGATKHVGFEFGTSYDFGQLSEQLDGLSAHGNLTYTHATAAAGVRKGKDISFYSRWVANLGFGYKYEQWTVNTDFFAQSKQVAPNKNDLVIEDAAGMYGNIAGYHTMSMRVAYDFSQQVKGLKAAVGVKNIFDQNYFTRSSDANGGKFEGQPRTIFVQTSFDF